MEDKNKPSLLQETFMRVPPMISVFITLFFLWAAVFYIHFDVVLSFIDIWMNDVTFYHCFTVFPISFYLIWQKRKALDRITPSFEPILLPAVIITGIATMLFWRVGINLFAHIAFILLLQSLMMIAVGWRGVKIIAFPIFFLFFAVPFGTEFIVPLQNLTANISVGMLRLINISVTYEGIHIITDHARFYVAEACAGLRFLIANIFAMSLYAHFTLRSKRSWLIFIPLSILFPILGNCLRAFIVMVIGHYSHGEFAAGVDHLLYGWGFFVVIAFGNFMIGEKLSKAEMKYDWEGRDDEKIKLDKIYKPYSLEPVKTIFHKRFFPATIFALLAAVGLNIQLDRIEKSEYYDYDQILAQVAPFELPENLSITEAKDKDYFRGTKRIIKEYFDKTTKIKYGTIFYPYQNADNESLNHYNKFHDEEKWFLLGQKKIMLNNVPYIAEISGILGHHKRITLYNYYSSLHDIHYETSGMNVKFDLLHAVLSHGTSAGGIFYMQFYIPPHMSLDDGIALLHRTIK